MAKWCAGATRALAAWGPCRPRRPRHAPPRPMHLQAFGRCAQARNIHARSTTSVCGAGAARRGCHRGWPGTPISRALPARAATPALCLMQGKRTALVMESRSSKILAWPALPPLSLRPRATRPPQPAGRLLLGMSLGGVSRMVPSSWHPPPPFFPCLWAGTLPVA
jgi:hypothetical protein